MRVFSPATGGTPAPFAPSSASRRLSEAQLERLKSAARHDAAPDAQRTLLFTVLSLLTSLLGSSDPRSSDPYRIPGSSAFSSRTPHRASRLVPRGLSGGQAPVTKGLQDSGSTEGRMRAPRLGFSLPMIVPAKPATEKMGPFARTNGPSFRRG